MVRALSKGPNGAFKARDLTRNVTGLGVEVVTADLDDLNGLQRAFAGAYGAFCVTNFWEHLSPEKELAQAANLAEAAKRASLQHVIWSTLEDTRRWVPLSDSRMPTLMARYKVPHFDAKGEADRCFADLGVPTTFLLTSFYWDNLIHFGMGPKKGPDGKLAIAFPMGDKKLPGMAEDIGKCALGVFKRGREFIGKTVGIAGEHLTGTEQR
ncbi:MAG: NmrA family NAD(P)-binding protein [Nitrospiraceae bacterium]